MEKLSSRLQRIRKERSYTQKQVADGIGVVEQHYQQYEYTDIVPSLKTLWALADFYDVSLDYLVGRTDEKEGE